MAPTAVFVVAVVAYAALAVAFAVAFLPGGTDTGLARWCLWTNIFFLWPAVRALLFPTAAPTRVSFPAAWGEAAVFFVTFTVSTFHHGCLNTTAVREAVAAETYWLLFIGALAALVSVIFVGRAWLTSVRYECREQESTQFLHVDEHVPPPRECQQDAHWRDRAWMCLGVGWMAAFGLVLAGFIVAMVRTPDELDGCAWPHAAGDPAYDATVVPELVRIWGGVDFVTAISAIAIGVLWLLQTTDTLNLAAFWTFAVALAIVQLYHFAGLVGTGTVLAVAGVVGGAFLCCQIIVCCSYPAPFVAELWKQYDLIDGVAALLAGGASLFLFFDMNGGIGHGFWHIFGGLFLYFLVESLYRKRSLGFLRL